MQIYLHHHRRRLHLILESVTKLVVLIVLQDLVAGIRNILDSGNFVTTLSHIPHHTVA